MVESKGMEECTEDLEARNGSGVHTCFITQNSIPWSLLEQGEGHLDSIVFLCLKEEKTYLLKSSMLSATRDACQRFHLPQMYPLPGFPTGWQIAILESNMAEQWRTLTRGILG